jgi:beta-lactamase class A
MRLLVVLLITGTGLAAQDTATRLQNEIERVSRISGGVVGVSAIHLESGKHISVRGTEPFPMASTFKVPIAVQLLDRIDRGEVKLDDMYTLQPSDLHPGSGTLSNLFTKPGVSLSIRNLMELMLLISDNSATDILLEKAGGAAAVTRKMRSLGLNGIRVDRPTSGLIADWAGAKLPPPAQMNPAAVQAAFAAVTPEERRAAALRFATDVQDTAFPDDMARLLEMIYHKRLHKPESAELLLDIMRRCQTGAARIKGMLPPDTPVANKTGTIGGTTNDVGIVTLPDNAGHVAMAIFVKNAPRTGDPSERTIAQVARATYDYFLYSQPTTTVNAAFVANKIVQALKPSAGERVVIRFDPNYMAALLPAVREELVQAGAKITRELAYLPKGQEEPAGRLAGILKDADIYIWLPDGERTPATTRTELKALADWTAEGGSHRELHCHWPQGSVLADGQPAAQHPADYDQLYEAALRIDHDMLRAKQDQAIASIQSGVVRLRTPAGTDLTFRTGDRPFNRQDGDASAARAQKARMRIDRHIELPAGVVRVAPIEDSVNGRVVIPWMRIGSGEARNVRMEFKRGVMTKLEADEGLDVVTKALEAAGPAGKRFREIGIGFHPTLVQPAESAVLPYYGYGAGVVRVSLGDNEELGGAVRGGFVRWLFLTDATVEAAGKKLVLAGRLQ